MTVWYFVRHGQSSWNRAGLVQGQVAHPALTPQGRDEALAAGRVIARDIRAAGSVSGARTAVSVFASDLSRAVSTARAVVCAVDPSVRVRLDPSLREQHLGRLQGMRQQEAFDAVADVDWSDPNSAIGGGESARAVHDRLARFFRLNSRDAPTIVVSHGDAIRFAVGWLTGHGPVDGPWLGLPTGGVVRVRDGVAEVLSGLD